jgi:hypothetical protein
MKISLLKWYMLAFMLVSDFVMFAQETDPADEDGDGDLETDDTPDAPINGKLIWLAIVGIAFAYSYYAKFIVYGQFDFRTK